MAATEDWLVGFKESAYFGKLRKIQQKQADFIIKTFTEMSYDYELTRPSEWEK